MIIVSGKYSIIIHYTKANVIYSTVIILNSLIYGNDKYTIDSCYYKYIMCIYSNFEAEAVKINLKLNRVKYIR